MRRTSEWFFFRDFKILVKKTTIKHEHENLLNIKITIIIFFYFRGFRIRKMFSLIHVYKQIKLRSFKSGQMELTAV